MPLVFRCMTSHIPVHEKHTQSATPATTVTKEQTNNTVWTITSVVSLYGYLELSIYEQQWLEFSKWTLTLSRILKKILWRKCLFTALESTSHEAGNICNDKGYEDIWFAWKITPGKWLWPQRGSNCCWCFCEALSWIFNCCGLTGWRQSFCHKQKSGGGETTSISHFFWYDILTQSSERCN